MRISSAFKSGKTVFSLEIFPPKKETGDISTIYKTLDGLESIKPDFISVTYGAGGNRADLTTFEICKIIKEKYNLEALAHLTCVNSTREDIDYILQKLNESNIENILALRGDIREGVMPKEDFRHASDLVEYIKNSGYDFSVSGACYPEVHNDAESPVSDILALKKKVECGAEHLVSQLFFDNNAFYSFLEKARIAGIDVPIEAGIMPVVNVHQINRMVSMCGASLPAKFSKTMSRFADNPQALFDAGVAYAIDQIIDLISNGVDGIHLYTMNNPQVAQKIFSAIDSMR
ncbi:MAG: methylenetetrahydrofolate reductase [NAD(P)H] [Ruminococcus sp.]|nr:methylenetetrahydrofolate reductase [NAD(P)H] [Ruminococcus sp.]